MNKNFFSTVLIILFSGSISIYAEEDTTALADILPVDESGKIIYRDVVYVEGQTPLQLYYKGIEWVNSYFPNPRAATSRRSPENGIIEGAHGIRLTDEHNGKRVPSKVINYKYKIEFREGRFRYTITDFTLRAPSRFPLERWLDKDGPYYSEENRDYLVQINETITDMIEKMVDYISKPEEPDDDDW